jgi:hypothetical protein
MIQGERLGEAGVIGFDVQSGGIAGNFTHDLGTSGFEHAEDLGFDPAFASAGIAAGFGEDDVVVECGEGIAGGDKEILGVFGRVVGNEKAEAFFIHRQFTDQQAGEGGRGVIAVRQTDEESFGLELLNFAEKVGKFFRFDVGGGGQSFLIEWTRVWVRECAKKRRSKRHVNYSESVV